MKQIKVVNGIEGDDIPYHVNQLGYKIENIKDTWFVSLNDHYGIHAKDWVKRTQAHAQNFSRVVFYDLVNTGDSHHPSFCDFIEKFEHQHKFYLTNNFAKNFTLENVSVVPWDFMWNRVKLYYTGLENLTGAFADPYLHHFAGKWKYVLDDIPFNTRSKVYLNLCGRAYGYRTKLYEYLEIYKNIGYRSLRSAGIALDDEPVTGAYVPIPNRYYNDSYISIYVESNCTCSNLIHITEKTFEPLIKGHFILPFANPGTINRIRELGFRLPEFIDYSYDDIIDTDTRFEVYKQIIDHVLKLDWNQLYKQNRAIVLHNRQQLWDLDYDRSILEFFK